MKLHTIEDLFNQLMYSVRKKRLDNKNFDGLKFWGSVKSILSKSDYEAVKWKNVPERHYHNIMKYSECYIDGYGKTYLIEDHHFLIQTVRIPKTESPSLRKIIQIALNIGQYLAYNNKTIIKRINISDYINKKDSNTKLSDILSNKDITKIKNILVKIEVK